MIAVIARIRTVRELWACGDCDCTERLERKLEGSGKPFLESLRHAVINLPSPRAPGKN